MERIIRNTSTNKVKKGYFGRGYESGWVDCLDSNGDVIAAEQSHVDGYYLQRAIDVRVNSRKCYLEDTDWYVLRENDDPGSYPSTIQTKRNDARTEINTIEALTTLSAVEAYDVDFT